MRGKREATLLDSIKDLLTTLSGELADVKRCVQDLQAAQSFAWFPAPMNVSTWDDWSAWHGCTTPSPICIFRFLCVACGGLRIVGQLDGNHHINPSSVPHLNYFLALAIMTQEPVLRKESLGRKQAIGWQITR